jgi:hypothetical protein
LICRRPNNGLDPTAGTVQVGGPGGGPGVAGSATGVVINTSYPFQSVGDARVTLGGPLGASVSLGGVSRLTGLWHQAWFPVTSYSATPGAPLLPATPVRLAGC